MNTEIFNHTVEQTRAAKNAPVIEFRAELKPLEEHAERGRPELQKAVKEKDALLAEVNATAWNEIPHGFPLNARQALHELEGTGDPVAFLDEGLRMLRGVQLSQINDPLNRWPIDPNRRAVLIEDIRLRLRAVDQTGNIRRCIAKVREQIDARAEDLQNASGDVGKPPELVIVPGKRPTPKPTKVDTFHKILP